jgi:hypothetical protein
VESESATVKSVNYSTNGITLTTGVSAAHASGAKVLNTAAGSAPITTSASVATGSESSAIHLAIRCESGYATQGSTTITPTGTTADDWALSADGSTWGTYGLALTITSTIGSTNTLFYAKYKAVAGESPSNDTSVALNTVATIIAA